MIRPEDAVKSGLDLAKRAQGAVWDLDRISARATIAPKLEALADALPERRASLAARVQEAREGIRRSRRAAWVRDIRFSFIEDQQQIVAWQTQVEDASATVTADRKRAGELSAFWRRANDLAQGSDLAPEIRERIASVVTQARRAELALARPEAVLIPMQSTLAEMKELTDSVLRSADREGPDLFQDATEYDFSIVGAVRGLRTVEDPVGTVKRTSRHMGQLGQQFLAKNPKELAAHAVFFLLVLLGAWSLKSQAVTWVGDEREGRSARQVVEHPLAAALLVSMVASLGFYEAMPTAAVLAVCIVAVASALFLFPRLLEPPLLRIGAVLGVFLLLDVVRLFVIEIAPLERVVLTFELVGASAILGSMLRRERWRAFPFAARWAAFYRVVAWIWLFGASIGSLAALAGYGSVAEILGGGVLASMVVALILRTAFEAISGAFWVLTQSALLQRLNVIKNYRARVVAVASVVLRWGALFLWARLSLGYLTLADSAEHAGERVLNASISVGALKVSVGDVAILGLGLALAVYTARFLRFLLEEDVMPRFELTEGTRQVTSSSAYYVALFLGFVLTLTAAGIQFDKLTILVGALGVGLGFGLQNVVQNFVAGLILMFGGPLKVRDKIQIGDLLGEVKTIGFRASTVRTFQGAEVIVPNAMLIADKVINWTMSDQKRRIEIDIGVQYGSDPDHIIALLREIGRAHPNVMKEPPPDALFLRHGESSLDFQLLAWVSFDDSATIRSELRIAIDKRLNEEKIGIPFPQRDLNLVSIDSKAADALRGLPSKPAKPAGAGDAPARVPEEPEPAPEAPARVPEEPEP
ncbi:MAG TPA: mechanosensitive ion channel domain-containing protein, partial [Polyangiaceae bacterium]|nr:mechanosensitive ion channel domain-containing protein [Polyangiaceae bacterium]